VTRKNDFEVLLFDVGGVLIDFAGFDELRCLLSGTPDRDEVRRRWIESQAVQLFERGDSGLLQFARGVIREPEIDITPDDFIATFVEWARGPYPGRGRSSGGCAPSTGSPAEVAPTLSCNSPRELLQLTR
jgi:hypothetical protein